MKLAPIFRQPAEQFIQRPMHRRTKSHGIVLTRWHLDEVLEIELQRTVQVIVQMGNAERIFFEQVIDEGTIDQSGTQGFIFFELGDKEINQ